MSTVLFGVAPLTTDVGAMFNTRADFQRTADATALAGVSGYVTDDMMLVRRGEGGSELFSDVRLLSQSRITQIGLSNGTYGTDSTYLTPNDITLGWIDVASGTSPIDATLPVGQYNAVQVAARRTTQDSNGPVNFLFASILGRHHGNVTASATAAFDDRALGFDPGVSPGYLLPFSVNEDEYAAQLAQENDDYSFDNSGGVVDNSPDGIGEIAIYPGNLAPGNFGLLNIGTPNQGAASQRGLWIQPVVFAGPGVILDPAAPSTNGRLGQLVLVR